MNNKNGDNHNEIRDFDKTLVFDICGGRRIVASMVQEISPDEELTFRYMIIQLEEDGSTCPLVSVDYEPHGSNVDGANSLYTLVYNYGDETPIHKIYPLGRRIAWVSRHDGTYRVNVRDVDNHLVRETSLEIDHIPNIRQAHIDMERVIKENPQYMWTRLSMEKAERRCFNNDVEIKIGGEYRQKSLVYHIIGLSGDVALLEVKEHGDVIQYIVVKHLHLDDDGKLLWHGDDEHFYPRADQENATSNALTGAWLAFCYKRDANTDEYDD